MATTICFINQKGGCGKSSTCFHLGGQFAADGYRVLLVDADPQGSLSQGFLGSEYVEYLDSDETLAACFSDRGLYVSLEQLVQPTGVPGLDIICANQSLASFNAPCPETTGLQQFTLGSLLGDVEHDLILIDCPPNLYQCSWNAMLAADFVVIPIPPEDFGTQGLRAVHQAIDEAQRLNPRLRLLGHLVTRFDRRLIVHQQYQRKLRDLYGGSVFQTVIPEASAFKVALACRKPVAQFSPRSPASRLTSQLSREILDRIAEPTQMAAKGA